jgi:hypothetical protein
MQTPEQWVVLAFRFAITSPWGADMHTLAMDAAQPQFWRPEVCVKTRPLPAQRAWSHSDEREGLKKFSH